MAKKVMTIVKLQIPAGQANPAPPVGPALGQHGVNIMEFCKAFNATTSASIPGRITPVEITIFEDRSFTFITKTPPAAVLIKEQLSLEKGSGEPEPQQGRQALAEPVARDRRDEDARPQRQRRRGGHADHRGHRPLHGRGGGGLMAGKRLKSAKAQVDRERLYQPLEAVRLLKSFEGAKFDEAVEAHFRLGLNVRHADQQLRGSLMLPHGTGRTKTVAVFAQGEHARAAEEAGADYVGADDLATRVQEGWTDFDVALATPDMMAVVGRLGRVLGPQGKMPNPRSGTITFEIAKAVEEIKAGKIEYRTENRAGLVHVVIGRKSFEVEQLVENYAVVLEEILRVKPASAKGRYIFTIALATTMGPGIKVDPSRTRDLLEERDSEAEALAPSRAGTLPLNDQPAPRRRQPAAPAGAEARPRWSEHAAEHAFARRRPPFARWARQSERRWKCSSSARKRSSAR